MMLRHIGLIVRKEFAQIKADPLLSRLLVVPVFVLVFIIGYALTTEVRHVTFAAVDRSNTPRSVALVRAFCPGDLFDFQGYLASEQELRRRLDDGSVKMGLVIPADFAIDLERDLKAQVQLVVDGVDANSAMVAGGYAMGIVNRWAFAQLRHRLAARGIDYATLVPVRVNTTVLYNPLLKSSWYMIPGTVVLLVSMITALMTGISLVREKERGTFEQLIVTPIRPLSLVLGKMIPFALIGLVEVTIFMVFASLWFRIPFRGNVLTVFGFAVIYMLSSLSIGILTSTATRTSQQVLFLTFFVILFFLMLSGLFIPVENMPVWVQYVTYVNPLRFFMTALRDIFLKGLGVAELWREAVVMAAIGAVMITLALVTFQRRAT